MPTATIVRCPLTVRVNEGSTEYPVIHEAPCTGELDLWDAVGRYTCRSCRRRFSVHEVERLAARS